MPSRLNDLLLYELHPRPRKTEDECNLPRVPYF
jgi:hypothetical protein